MMLIEDVPKTLTEFNKRFGTEEACREHLRAVKWPNGFLCDRCGCDECKPISTRPIYVCRECKRHHSLTSGTAFHSTKKGLKLWFQAMYLFVASKGGISALSLQSQLGLGSYQTAWSWLQKLRRCMVVPGRKPLEAPVEVAVATSTDEETQSVVACAVERDGPRVGRVRLAAIASPDEGKLSAFVSGTLALERGFGPHAWRDYAPWARSGYALLGRICQGAARNPACGALELFKRLLIATYHGSVSRKHLQRYLHEFEFRFNRRTSHARTHLFRRLLEGVVLNGHTACSALCR
jgi:transposase-like protein